jgi:hypothetical protein
MSLPFEVALAPGYGRTRKSQTALVEPRILRRLRSWPFSFAGLAAPDCRFRREAQPARDIDTVAAESLKALDPKRPIREADIFLLHSRA